MQGGGGIKGKNWENCNSIINKIYFKKRKKLDCHLTPYIKSNSKWIKDLNIKDKTIKLLEKNLVKKIHDMDFDSDFLEGNSENESKYLQIRRAEINV